MESKSEQARLFMTDAVTDTELERVVDAVGKALDVDTGTISEARFQAAVKAARAAFRSEAFDRFREDAEQFLRDAAAADTHSSDVDPGDHWEDR